MEDQLSQKDDYNKLETFKPELTSGPTKPSYLVPVLLGSLTTAAVLIMGYLVYGSFKPASLITQASPSPVVDQTPSPFPDTLDQTNWNTYSNSVHNVSFKYPLGWQLTKENDLAKYNASIKLTKDQATIHMIFGVDGIGGSGVDYEGVPFTLDGNNVFKFKAHNTHDNSESVGVTDSLKESLGVLMLNKKTYLINLKYPTKYIESGESINLEKTFDEILSAFKFIGNTTLSTSITGKLCYPSDFIPPGEVIAINIANGEKVQTAVKANQMTYSLLVSPGTYNIRYQAHASGTNPNYYISGYYTTCSQLYDSNDICIREDTHKPIPLEVNSQKEIKNINLCDFGNNPDQESSMNKLFNNQ